MSLSLDHIELPLSTRIKAFYELLKPRLSFLVVFSSGFGYLLANHTILSWTNFILFLLGGFFISGSSVIINQIIEQDFDAMMTRTKNRPIPSGKVTIPEAIWFSVLTGILGLGLLFISTNPLTTGLSTLSLLLYAFVYTPLKRVGSIAVFVGAIPGALPPLIGWTAASGLITYEALIIFGIQFIWQFPHFWAIAWVCDSDYKKA
ncbi:MAG: heme o synthase, partial [Bacteroidota bacterium]